MNTRWMVLLSAAAMVLGGCGSKVDVPATWTCGNGGGTCQEGQVCSSSYWEGEPETHYNCVAIPDPCGDDPSCECLKANVCGGQLAPMARCGCDETGCYVDCVVP